MEMRKILSSELSKAMTEDDRIVVINADLAKAAGLSSLTEKFPDRCFNVGIAEQNMASVAAGLSSYGFNPFIFTFTPFASRRMCDQIAISVCYAKQSVKIFGLDPGIVAENNGGTHMSFEDVGIYRSMPSMSVFEPCDEIQLRKSFSYIVDYKGPLYIRLFRKETPVVLDESYEFTPNQCDMLTSGEDVSIFCSGIMVYESLKACEILKSKGISCDVVNVHTVKPIDKDSILKSVNKTKCAIVAENHNKYGGLFSSLCEITSEYFPIPIRSISINDKFGQVGNLEFLKKCYNLSSDDIVNSAIEVINLKKVV